MDCQLAQADSLDVKLPGHLGARFLAEHPDLVERAEAAVRPFSVRVSGTQDGVHVDGDNVAVMVAARVLERFAEVLPRNGRADMSALDETVSAVVDHTLKRDLVFRLEGLRHSLRPMTLSQVAFLQTLLSPSAGLIIGSGPTGTGKTHLAIAAALNQLALERVKHIVVTRPHVMMEGEVLTPSKARDMEYDQQFDFFEDILRDLVGYEEFTRLVEQRSLEIMPIGRMRGRTFNEAYIIVDEAQNMSVRTMRMVVTRIGRASRMVITGDPAQIDLRGDEPSGLPHLLRLVEGTDIATVHHFEINQIVRNGIVARLEELYARGSEGAFA